MLVLAFTVGLIIGSFINVLIDGLPAQAGNIFSRRRSQCDHCKRPLRWYELVPVLSFIVLGGRCLRCKKKIPWRYTIVELITGLLVAAIFWKSQGDLVVIALALSLFVLALIDFDTQTVPDLGLQISLYLALVSIALKGQTNLEGAFAGMLVSLAVFVPFVFVSRGEIMGEADLLVAVILGLWLGFPPILVALLAAFIIGGTVGGFAVATGRKKRTDTLGFVPYLVGGGLIAFIFGDQLINAYLGLL